IYGEPGALLIAFIGDPAFPFGVPLPGVPGETTDIFPLVATMTTFIPPASGEVSWPLGSIPANLPSERRGTTRDAEVGYWTGMALDALGNKSKAEQAWRKAAETTPQRSRRRRDNQMAIFRGPQTYYQALALRKLGDSDKAESILRSLVDMGRKAAGQGSSKVDSGASAEQQTSQRGRVA
ncbi:MAG: tetratricopeptide repeat protein, partial [bacterium]|nr:tetratricopeptide repeat protein [bacterium]